MIMVDIDDTLIDYTSAEKSASLEFGKYFSSQIPDYDLLTFSDQWHYYMEKYYQEFLAGNMTYLDQRRNRIKAIFQDRSIANEKADEIYSVYKHFYVASWKLFDDVLPFLEKYKHDGFIAITDGQQQQQENKLHKTGIIKYFKHIIAAETITFSKPHIRIFQAALSVANLNPSQCVYIGDSLEKDAIGSKNAGMIGVWLNRNNKNLAHNVIEIKSLTEFKSCA